MALINCPECNKQISDKAVSCPNCGYPLQNKSINTKTDKNTYSIILLSAVNEIETIKFIKDVKNISLSEAIYIVDYLPQTVFISLNKTNLDLITNKLNDLECEFEIKTDNNISNSQDNEKFENYVSETEKKLKKGSEPLRCPRCGSTSVVIGQRGFSLLTGFLGSNKTTNRCGKCGYTWQPRKD